MVDRDKLVEYCNKTLNVDKISDSSLNGLQVEGKNNIRKLVSAVSLTTEVIEKAVEKNADAILVHHGIFWSGVRPAITRVMKKRVKLLLDNEMNLLAYHLPLDLHPIYGNNIQIARTLNLKVDDGFGNYHGFEIGYRGRLKKQTSFKKFVDLVKRRINPDPLVFDFGKKFIKTVGIISGGASFGLNEAIELGLDVFLTGEPQEFTEGLSKDAKINVIFAGHYATEVFGVKAFGEHLSKKFKIKHEFLDIKERL
ncbi:MAG: Nif3-like dinuclear metal center hexameric protein [Candidatus Aenigmarchaeota archaeon]|nr:Nif3-like dinuclear metal center hexameric protein [Candidatus Aenigmarchaeota archaeon]